MGSVSIAFILLFLVGKLIIQTEDFSWVVLLVVYGVDSVLTIIHRLMLHENITFSHRKYMYQLMANELKMPHVLVSTIYMVTLVFIAGVYLIYPGNITFFATLAALIICYALFMIKYYHLHEEN